METVMTHAVSWAFGMLTWVIKNHLQCHKNLKKENIELQHKLNTKNVKRNNPNNLEVQTEIVKPQQKRLDKLVK